MFVSRLNSPLVARKGPRWRRKASWLRSLSHHPLHWYDSHLKGGNTEAHRWMPCSMSCTENGSQAWVLSYGLKQSLYLQKETRLQYKDTESDSWLQQIIQMWIKEIHRVASKVTLEVVLHSHSVHPFKKTLPFTSLPLPYLLSLLFSLCFSFPFILPYLFTSSLSSLCLAYFCKIYICPWTLMLNKSGSVFSQNGIQTIKNRKDAWNAN